MPAGLPAVILIDDNVEFAGLLGTLIAEQGMTPVLAHTAEDGARMLEVYPDAAALVVDLLLPDMTGQKLLARLVKAKQTLPPVFIITGVFKGLGQQEKVRNVCDYAGWFEKPFDTRVLVERIVRAAGREPLVRQQHQRVGKVTDGFDINILEPADPESVVAGPRPAKTADLVIPEEELDIDISVDVDMDIDVDEDAAEEAFEPSENPTVIEVSEPFEPSSPIAEHSNWGLDSTPTPAAVAEGLRTNLRIGNLEETTVPALLQAFYIAQETGEVVFERQTQRKIVYFVEGSPVFAMSNQDADRFGSIAKRLGGIPEKELASAIDEVKKHDILLGDVLIHRRLIDRNRRDELLAEQTRAIVRSLFTWTAGRYVIGFKPRTQFELDTPAGDHPAHLIVNGIRDLFELPRLKELVPPDLRPTPSPNPPFELYELPLRDAEALLLLKTTGARTVETIADEMADRLTERDVLGTIYALLTLGVLVSGRGSPSRSASP